ncbi:MAG: ATP phosphoribosyltransferase regulatory subunit [Rhodospirillaceae bacterium]|nr:ATP phosphoribosyltransferase regulatory subunit [Rhodospirillaceae bacterium]MYI48869.1 ATP phosphoribosyltransferase regulatory subunit [Rhodospirillaceae bacterium]
MAISDNRGLLPAGLRDVLAPDAAHESAIVERLLGTFAGWGYRRVKPPLVEFERSLLEGAGAAMAGETFRLMDPVSQAMMGVRADMTLQIARIAASRLAAEARPLRLSYAGDVLRVRGTQLRPERQFVQVGGELIGAAGPAADTEVVLMAVRALRDIGVERLSVDLTFPTLISSLCRSLAIADEREAAVRAALDSKDRRALAAALQGEGEGRAVFLALLDATGPVGPGLALLEAADMPEEARADVDHLADVAARLGAAAPDLALTVDPVEYRGFEYHTGIGFTVYRNGSRGEIGAGGRYLAGSGFADRTIEPATGFTLFLDTVIRSLPAPREPSRTFAPDGTPPETVDSLRREGRTVVAGLEPAGDIDAEARRLGCDTVVDAGAPRAVGAGRPAAEAPE